MLRDFSEKGIMYKIVLTISFLRLCLDTHDALQSMCLEVVWWNLN